MAILWHSTPKPKSEVTTIWRGCCSVCSSRLVSSEGADTDSCERLFQLKCYQGRCQLVIEGVSWAVVLSWVNFLYLLPVSSESSLFIRQATYSRQREHRRGLLMSMDKEQAINETKGTPYCPKWKHLRTTALMGQTQENSSNNQILSMRGILCVPDLVTSDWWNFATKGFKFLFPKIYWEKKSWNIT